MFEFPPLHQQVIARYREDTSAVRERAEQEIRRRIEFERDAVAELDRVTAEFLMTGIASLQADHMPVMPLLEGRTHRMSWVDYVKAMAKELKRPAVAVVESAIPQHPPHHYVHIERRVYTEPLIARFLMLPTTSYVPYSTTRYWCFYVVNENTELIDNWRAACRKDPELRKALRLQTFEPVGNYRP